MYINWVSGNDKNYSAVDDVNDVDGDDDDGNDDERISRVINVQSWFVVKGSWISVRISQTQISA